ncbi:hypothetical protein [Desulforhopalus singaporensis]|uniref:Uncharacterized protein n=1 Tax=Desulforhopalus singaporensis TaxID=91360 RepID=A0A1H0VBH2_9BACT|nr:hypothetical protein [Desulforhopalus singaporensis]SDP75882.1 hypothetical protein SAMN05660330_03980 [Desulforhopalus singaporensis]
MSNSYPLDSIQSLLSELAITWWEESPGNDIQRGDLVSAFIPHVDQFPFGVKPSGRPIADSHNMGVLDVQAMRVGAPIGRRSNLPVAAMTLHKGEWWSAYRAKIRPCIVIAEPGDEVLKKLRKDMPRNSTAPTLLVAPYYGVDKDGSRAGYNPRFVDAVRHAEFKQFMVDSLPNSGKGPKESILRFDQIQPIGFSNQACEKVGYRLSDGALGIIDDWIQWYLWDDLPSESWILELHSYIKATIS